MRGRIERLALRRDRLVQELIDLRAQVIAIAFRVMSAGPVVKSTAIVDQAWGAIAPEHLGNEGPRTLDWGIGLQHDPTVDRSLKPARCNLIGVKEDAAGANPGWWRAGDALPLAPGVI